MDGEQMWAGAVGSLMLTEVVLGHAKCGSAHK